MNRKIFLISLLSFLVVFFITTAVVYADSISVTLDGIPQKVNDEYIQRLKIDYNNGSNGTIKCVMANSTFINNSDPTEVQDISNLKIYDETTGISHIFSSGTDTVLETGLSPQMTTKYYQLKLKLENGFKIGNYINTIIFNITSDNGSNTGNSFIIYNVEPYLNISIVNQNLINSLSSENSAKFNFSKTSDESMHLLIESNTNWDLILEPKNSTGELPQAFQAVTASPSVTNYVNTFTNFSEISSLKIANGERSVSNHNIIPIELYINSKVTTPNKIIPAGNSVINVIFTLMTNL